MIDQYGRLEAELSEVRDARDRTYEEKRALDERIQQIAAIIGAPINGEMDDVSAFGRGAWVYCRQHMRAHETGWCSVSPRDKIGLGVTDGKQATDKCREWGFELYADLKK